MVISLFLYIRLKRARGAIGQAVLYKRYYVGVKPRYPLGVADQDDIYFPRFNIPRPLYLDERERKRKEIEQQEKTEQDQ